VVRSHIATLTPRERQVFELIVRGNTNKHIARAIGGTERTIKASSQGDGENAGPILGRTRFPC
jgi:FixJ family two-component response regulator